MEVAMGAHEEGFGFVNSAAMEIEAEEKQRVFRSMNVTCSCCADAEFEELVLGREEHGIVSDTKIWEVHDLRVICEHTPNGNSLLSCRYGTKSDCCARCDRCAHADRTITTERSEKTRGVNGSMIIKTMLYHCKYMGRNDYCYPYFHCDKFKPIGDKK